MSVEARPLVIIGSGNMAEAIVAGAMRVGVLRAEQALAIDPSAARRDLFRERFGIRVMESPGEIAPASDVLLAVKPQIFPELVGALRPLLSGEALLISIMAGVPTARIGEALGHERVARVMPNLPLTVGAGASGYFASAAVTADDAGRIERLFGSAGVVVRVEREELMDVVTALSGSGPAYYYLVTEVLAAAAVEAGLDAESAGLLARQTCLGAGRMMAETGDSPGVLREKVTSRGGTTAAALDALQERGLVEALRAGLEAAVRRGQELGAKS